MSLCLLIAFQVGDLYQARHDRSPLVLVSWLPVRSGAKL